MDSFTKHGIEGVLLGRCLPFGRFGFVRQQIDFHVTANQPRSGSKRDRLALKYVRIRRLISFGTREIRTLFDQNVQRAGDRSVGHCQLDGAGDIAAEDRPSFAEITVHARLRTLETSETNRP